MKNKAAVVILNMNGKNFLEQFLPPLTQYTSLPDVELAVADSGSNDGSQEFVKRTYPQITWIGLDKNYGFTGGYNRALQQIDAKYYILLNSDVEVTENWLLPMLDYMDAHPETAVCMPKILSFSRRNYFEYAGAAGGFMDKYGYPFCRGRILNHLEKDEGQYDSTREIFWASGACMTVRMDVYHKLGGLDDNFFAHMEEIDFCWRAKQLGYNIVCLPQSIVYHIGGGTMPKEAPLKLFLNYRNSLFMLYKNLPSQKRLTILIIRLLLDGVAAMTYIIQGKFKAFATVLIAHVQFWKRRKKLRKLRIPAQQRINTGDNCIYQQSILVAFYLKKQKTFDKIFM